MNIDISSLEAKVEQVVAFCQELRAENIVLRDRIAGLEQEKQALTERMTAARERIETLMERLPEE
jgi:cell division protein ZapB